MAATTNCHNYFSQFLPIIFLLAIYVHILEAYKPVAVKIDLNPSGKPAKVFTKDSIAEFDASEPDKPIYLAVRGVVFDVTKGKDFYSKKSEYNVLAGKDASRAHALWSLEAKDLNHDLTGLTDSQLEGLDLVFQETYMKKYPVVGYMDYLIEQQEEGIQKKLRNDEL